MLQRQGAKGAILAVPVRIEDRRECSDEKSFHNVSNWRDGLRMVPLLRS